MKNVNGVFIARNLFYDAVQYNLLEEKRATTSLPLPDSGKSGEQSKMVVVKISLNPKLHKAFTPYIILSNLVREVIRIILIHRPTIFVSMFILSYVIYVINYL